jgi:hypothetical protein
MKTPSPNGGLQNSTSEQRSLLNDKSEEEKKSAKPRKEEGEDSSDSFTSLSTDI